MRTQQLFQWAVLDQALVSAANFLSGVIIARFLGFEAYGRYTLLWGMATFLSALQLSIIVSPFQSMGPKVRSEDWERYLRGVCTQQIIFAFTSALLVLVGMFFVASIVPAWDIRQIAIPFSLAILVTQIQDFIRRYLLAQRRVILTVTMDVMRYGGYLILLLVAYRHATLDLASIFWAIVIAASASLVMGVRVFKLITLDIPTLVDVAKRHFTFYRWLFPATVIQWGNANVLIYCIGFQLGDTAVGIFRACQNLVAVVNMAIEGLENIFPVQAARRLAADGYDAFRLFIMRAARLIGGAVLIYAAVIMVNPDYWIGLVYGRGLAGHGSIIAGFALSSVIFAPVYVLHVALRTMEAARVIFMADLSVAIWLLATAPFVVAQWGVGGAVTAMVMSFLIRLMVLGGGFRKADQQMRSSVAGR